MLKQAGCILAQSRMQLGHCFCGVLWNVQQGCALIGLGAAHFITHWLPATMPPPPRALGGPTVLPRVVRGYF
jgi:hypothetical protein